MTVPHFQSFVASAAQQDTSIYLQTLPYALIATGAVIAGVIFLVIFRKLTRFHAPRGHLPGFNLSALEDMRKKGLLSEEEFRRLRDVVVRQTMEGEEQPPARDTDPQLAAVLAAASADAASARAASADAASMGRALIEKKTKVARGMMETRPAPPVAPNVAAPTFGGRESGAAPPHAPARPAAVPAPDVAPAGPSPQPAATSLPESDTGESKKSKPLDIEALLERGLISREEYERLRQHFRRPK